jgi:tripartite ATP-independent transporter DctP family solute receptor
MDYWEEKSMTTYRSLLKRFAGAAVAGLLLLPVALAMAAPLKLRISGENPMSGLDLTMAKYFGDELKKTLGADFDYELFHTQALGNEQVHLQMIRTGQIDVYPMGSDAVTLDPAWGVFDLPFIFKDRAAVAKALDGEIGERLRKSMRQKAGIEVLAFGEIGFRQITNNTRPINKPEDLRGIKIRVPGSQTRLLTFQTYGANPVTMNLGELYLALQQGTVDGQENPLLGTVNRSFHEVQTFLSMSNHVYTPVTLAMNARKYDSLTPEQKKAVKEAAQKAAEHVRKLGTEGDERLIKQLTADGKIKINEIDLAAFQAASKPVYEKIGQIAGPELTEAFIAAAR